MKTKWVGCALLILTGCAPYYGHYYKYWYEKLDGTDQEFQAAIANCRAETLRDLPYTPRQIQTSSGYTYLAYYKCTGFQVYAATCRAATDRYSSPSYMTVDLNSGARIQAIDRCLLQNGWHDPE